jgi:hypothetical protein
MTPIYTAHSTTEKFYDDAFSSLDVACDGEAPLAKKLRCKNLLTDLTLANVALRHQLPKTATTFVSKELDRLLERLRRRTNLSEAVTLNSFLKLSSEAQDILGSMLALETRDQFDQFFDGVTELFQSIAGADLKVSNHYNKQPKTPFETVLHAGHCLIDVNVSYHATVKAYGRFKERQ